MTRFTARTGDEIRALQPAARDAWAEIETNVLRSGVADQALKELCFRFLADDEDVREPERFSGRERAALEWTYAIAFDSAKADDALWSRLHALFSEPELVDLGCAIGFELGRQHWRRSVGLPGRGA
jgi:alkylhydroperoxidase family enzyme